MTMGEFIKRFWEIIPTNAYEGPNASRLRNSPDPAEVLIVLEEYVQLNEPKDVESSVESVLDEPTTKDTKIINVNEMLQRHNWYI